MPDEKNIAWFCAYTPLEILDAAGLHPARRFGNPHTLESADATLHPAICPYVRACLAGEEEAEAAGPHHAVFVNSCDGMRRLYDAWKARFPDSFVHLVDLPRQCGPLGERLLALEFRRLAARLEEAWGARITADGLREAARAREERRREYLRRADGSRGSERLRLAMAFQERPGAGAPPPDGGRGSAGGDGVPVLLTGNLLNPEGLVSSLDAAGARAAWIDLCNADRAFSAPVWPEGPGGEGGVPESVLASLARGYLDRHPCARMSDGGRRYSLLLERAREVGARGVIYASLKFCDAYLYDFPRLRERLSEAGVPVLRLESDYADGHAGQVLTRVEAFLEMI